MAQSNADLKTGEMTNVSSDNVHDLLGGGKAADILLWRKKKVSFRVLSVLTFVWVNVDLLGIPFVSLMCFVFLICFICFSCVGTGLLYFHLGPEIPVPDHLPQVLLPTEPFREAAFDIHMGINHALDVLTHIYANIDFKRYILVSCGLIFLSYVGRYVTTLAFFYVVIVLLFTVPVSYETGLALYEKCWR